jgi:hypothetical protein
VVDHTALADHTSEAARKVVGRLRLAELHHIQVQHLGNQLERRKELEGCYTQEPHKQGLEGAGTSSLKRNVSVRDNGEQHV